MKTCHIDLSDALLAQMRCHQSEASESVAPVQAGDIANMSAGLPALQVLPLQWSAVLLCLATSTTEHW